MKLVKWLLVAGMVLVVLAAADKYVVIPNRVICFENGNGEKKCIGAKVASTGKEREKGLSGKLWMGENTGMLFEFEELITPKFWMKEMNFGLDFVWIKGEEIVEITELVPVGETSGELKIYTPREKVDKVLEVNAGWVGRKGIKAGSKIKY